MNERNADDRHVRDRVLEAGDHEDQDAPNGHDKSRGFFLKFERAPNGEADENITKNAAKNHLKGREGEFRRGNGGEVLGNDRNRIGARVVVDGYRDPATDQVAEPTKRPKRGNLAPEFRLIKSNHANREVVSRKKFAPGGDDERERGSEGYGRADFRDTERIRAEREDIAAYRHRDNRAESDEHTGDHRGDEEAARVVFKGGKLVSRHGEDIVNSWFMHNNVNYTIYFHPRLVV